MATPKFPVVPVYAEMVLGSIWSGWAWEEGKMVNRFKLVYRLQGSTAFASRTFKTWGDVEQFCDGLEGDTDEFTRD